MSPLIDDATRLHMAFADWNDGEERKRGRDSLSLSLSLSHSLSLRLSGGGSGWRYERNSVGRLRSPSSFVVVVALCRSQEALAEKSSPSGNRATPRSHPSRRLRRKSSPRGLLPFPPPPRLILGIYVPRAAGSGADVSVQASSVASSVTVVGVVVVGGGSGGVGSRVRQWRWRWRQRRRRRRLRRRCYR